MDQINNTPPGVTASPLSRRRFKGRYSRIGLDLGTSQLKLVQLKKKRGRIVLHQYGIYPLPEGAIQGGRVADPGALVDRLKWVLKRRRLHKNRVHLCVGSQTVILRQLLLPKMSLREIPGALRWEAEKQVMIPLDEAVLDYIYIGERIVEEKEVMELALVAVPKEVVNGYIEVMTRAGLFPEVLEIEPFALERVFSYYWESATKAGDGAVMLLDIGGESSNLVVLENGRYHFSRALSIGANHFCRRVAELREINPDNAGRLIFGGDPFAVEGVQEVADELLAQVRRSLEFYLYNVGHEKKEFQALYLCGGGAFIDRLASFLGFELKVEPKSMNPLTLMEGNRKFTRTDLEQEAGLLNVAVGLALRGWIR